MRINNYMYLDDDFKYRYEKSQELVLTYQQRCDVERWIDENYAALTPLKKEGTYEQPSK